MEEKQFNMYFVICYQNLNSTESWNDWMCDARRFSATPVCWMLLDYIRCSSNFIRKLLQFQFYSYELHECHCCSARLLFHVICVVYIAAVGRG